MPVWLPSAQALGLPAVPVAPAMRLASQFLRFAATSMANSVTSEKPQPMLPPEWGETAKALNLWTTRPDPGVWSAGPLDAVTRGGVFGILSGFTDMIRKAAGGPIPSPPPSPPLR